MAVNYRTAGSVAVIEVDNPPVNALSVRVRDGLLNVVERAASDPSVKSVVLSGKRSFLGGADITEFKQTKQKNNPTIIDVCDAIESGTKPVVAAISGYALGGGAEVAISCHYRVISSEATFGFPEVDIGILPAATGTQRFPRLTSLQTALELIPTGKRISGDATVRSGICDKVVTGDVLSEAIAFARTVQGRPMENRRTSHKSVKDAHKLEELVGAAMLRAKTKQKGMFAPINCVRAVAASVLPFQQGLGEEARLAAQLMTSAQARALQYAFFAQRAAIKWRDGARVPGARADMRTCGVVGGGTMGSGIAMAALNGGMTVILLEKDQKFLDRGLKTVRGLLEGAAQLGKITADQCKVVEAVFENMEVKKAVFRELDRVCRPGAVLASNTSTLDIDEMASVTRRPADVIGTHFFVPAYHMRLLENVRGRLTSHSTIDRATSFGLKLNKVPVLVGNCNGFVGNRMLGPRSLEALFLLEEGATPDQIDSVMEDFGFPMGTFKVADLSGLDIGYSSRRERLKAQGLTVDHKKRYLNGVRQCHLSDILVEQGRLGRKTGKGWYRYARAGAKEAMVDRDVHDIINQYCRDHGLQRRNIGSQEILERCLYSLINEGFKCLEEGMAAKPEAIDTIWLLGYGWPRQTGGPMYYAATIGLDTVYQRILYYYQRNLTSPHWMPSGLLKRLAAAGNPPLAEWGKTAAAARL